MNHFANAVLAVENWKSLLQRYDDFCAAHGIAPVDITSFAAKLTRPGLTPG